MSVREEWTVVSFDWAMKHILRDKANFDVLEGFFCALLETDIRVLALLENEGNQVDEDARFNKIDLLVEDEWGIGFIIEVQYNYASHYLRRLFYNTSKLITDSMTAGYPYNKVKKIVSISLLYFPFGNAKKNNDYIYHGKTEFYGFHNGKHLSVGQGVLRVESDKSKQSQSEINLEDGSEVQKETEDKQSDVIHDENIFPEYYVIAIDRFPSEVKSALDEWIYYFKYSEIPDDFRSKNIQITREKLSVLQMKLPERRAYERYQMAKASYQDEIQSAIAAGREERRKGISIKIALQMLRYGESIDKISLYTGLNKTEIEKLQQKVRSQ